MFQTCKGSHHLKLKPSFCIRILSACPKKTSLRSACQNVVPFVRQWIDLFQTIQTVVAKQLLYPAKVEFLQVNHRQQDYHCQQNE